MKEKESMECRMLREGLKEPVQVWGVIICCRLTSSFLCRCTFWLFSCRVCAMAGTNGRSVVALYLPELF